MVGLMPTQRAGNQGTKDGVPYPVPPRSYEGQSGVLDCLV